jgi:CheY-like chemotaxis protein
MVDGCWWWTMTRNCCRQLLQLGYLVLTANNGPEALERLETDPAIRLLYTDVKIPEPWNGVRLAKHALSRRPGLAVFFTSGDHRPAR